MLRLDRTVVATLLATSACLTRPVETTDPTTKSSITIQIRSVAVDKIDLLLAIDNSASMKDKQAFLAAAVPRLVDRLVTPNCVEVAEDGSAKPTGEQAQLLPSGAGQCEGTAKPEFKPITDIHVGVVSSSHGNFGSTGDDAECNQPNADDHAELLARGAEHPLEPGNFLAWYPPVESHDDPGHVAPVHAYTDARALSADFADLVRGTSDEGCGTEAQLESMYQFLIAPQPWRSIVVDGDDVAHFDGVDETALAQRSDFLRPDSLVAVIMLTDEDDSSVDPLSVGGKGHLFMRQNFPQNASLGTPTHRDDRNKTTPAARGTPVCETEPASPDCHTCASGGCPPDAAYHTDDDDMNVRFFDMKRRFGVDPQYPISRYVRGFQAAAVPSREPSTRAAPTTHRLQTAPIRCSPGSPCRRPPPKSCARSSPARRATRAWSFCARRRRPQRAHLGRGARHRRPAHVGGLDEHPGLRPRHLPRPRRGRQGLAHGAVDCAARRPA